jgi:hypothetical protein
MKKKPSKQTKVTLELTPDVAHQYVVAISQLRAVNGLLLADNIARISGNDSPLDSDETLIATVHLMRDSLGALERLPVHKHMLDRCHDRAALSVEEG